GDGRGSGGRGRGGLEGPAPHGATRLRLRAGQQRARHEGTAGLPWTSQHPAYGALHRAIADAVQGFLAQMTAWRVGYQASGALQPAPHARAVATVSITELALEIGFLAGYYAVADDEREGHQHYQQPEIVERDGQADQTQEHAEVNGAAREAVRSALDDSSAWQVGGDVRTGHGDSNNGPGE